MPEYECPVCDTGEVFDNPYDLASHLVGDHGWVRCRCGVGLPAKFDVPQFLLLMAKHIAKVEDWELHVAQAELLKVARARRSDGQA